MMRKRLAILAGLATAAFAGAVPFAAPAVAQAISSATLDSLAGGEWSVRFRNGDASRSICARSGRELIQLRHRGASCRSFVVSDDNGSVTVHYTCPGNGYGRTTIKRETGNILQIHSQGIEGGTPFDFSAEGRRAGACR